MILLFLGESVYSKTFFIGAQREYKNPRAVASLVADGDTVLIDPGIYKDEAVIWRKNNLTLMAEGEYAQLIAPKNISNQKAIWVIQGGNVLVKNIEFTQAVVPDKNGAGIRAEGFNLRVENCYFHQNENGLLGGKGHVKIYHSHFAYNGHGDGYSHNLYIGGRTDSLTFKFNYSHGAKVGHELKSRAKVNIIEYNRIMNEKDGNASYSIDLPNGGFSLLKGNIVQQSEKTSNSTLISYGAEGLKNPNSRLYVINNTLVNDRHIANFIRIQSGALKAVVENNLYLGKGDLVRGIAEQKNNMHGDDSDVQNRAEFDFHLAKGSKAIDAGGAPSQVNGLPVLLDKQYLHKQQFESRPKDDRVDIGAFEYMKPNSLTVMSVHMKRVRGLAYDLLGKQSLDKSLKVFWVSN